ncbi:MAG TPA: hypothetical protein VG223_07760 [Solirubrobacteraceae bacterium]|nr:hypothetical protein [Solirubrobacteraceae bacterium]
MYPLDAAALAHHRAIIALDIERSTSRDDMAKAELRGRIYEFLDAALRAAGIEPVHRDEFFDLGDGILTLIHPVQEAPKLLLVTHVIPYLNDLLIDYNAGVSCGRKSDYQLRVRVVVHGGEVHYDAHGCFGEALDIAFRLLNAVQVKKTFRSAPGPLVVVASDDFYWSVIRHGGDQPDRRAFQSLVRVRVADRSHNGWVQLPDVTSRKSSSEVNGDPLPWASPDTALHLLSQSA